MKQPQRYKMTIALKKTQKKSPRNYKRTTKKHTEQARSDTKKNTKTHKITTKRKRNSKDTQNNNQQVTLTKQ